MAAEDTGSSNETVIWLGKVAFAVNEGRTPSETVDVAEPRSRFPAEADMRAPADGSYSITRSGEPSGSRPFMPKFSTLVADERSEDILKLSCLPAFVESAPERLQAPFISEGAEELITGLVNVTRMASKSVASAEAIPSGVEAPTAMSAEPAADSSASESLTAATSTYRCGSAMAAAAALPSADSSRLTSASSSCPADETGVTCPAAFWLPAPSLMWNLDGSVRACHRPSENRASSAPTAGSSEADTMVGSDRGDMQPAGKNWREESGMDGTGCGLRSFTTAGPEPLPLVSVTGLSPSLTSSSKNRSWHTRAPACPCSSVLSTRTRPGSVFSVGTLLSVASREESSRW